MAVKRQKFRKRAKPKWATTCFSTLEPPLYERHTMSNICGPAYIFKRTQKVLY